MALNTVTTISRSSPQTDWLTAMTAADAGGTDWWVGTGAEQLIVNNGSGSSLTVTLNYGAGGTVDGQTLPAKTWVIAAGKFGLTGPFPTGLYNAATTNYVTVAWSATTSIKFMVFLRGN